MEDIILTIPVIALRGLTVLPGMSANFDISRDKSIKAVEKAMNTDQQIFLITQRDPDEAEPDLDGLFHYGTIARIRQLVKMPGSVMRVMTEGYERARLVKMDTIDGMFVGELLREEPQDDVDDYVAEAMVRVLKEQIEEFGTLHPKFAKEVMNAILADTDLLTLMNDTAAKIPWDYTVRQDYLEQLNYTDCYQLLVGQINKEIEISRIHQDFQEKVKQNVDKNQKDYILREQMNVIRQELGDDGGSEIAELEKKVSELEADDEVKNKLYKEIDRLREMPDMSQEATVIRGYVDTLLELPWNKVSEDNNDIHHAEEILNADHYGLEQVKERVLEHLAVRMLTNSNNGAILCLVGPPGTGKTSIGQSIARALNKKYVRIALGGVRDEAEIRGHRRTYIGSMPGRIVEGLRQAGVANPLMVLDEIDKVGSDYKGDTASALLEVLDGEQNSHFRDNYVELPVDLSQVMFLATANSTDTIPTALLDRMEIIEVNSYTENEKFHIGKEFLIPKQKAKHGIAPGQLSITDAALKKIIHNYTREAGVRNLERRIGDICRKAARMILEDGKKRLRVTEAGLERYLGQELISYEDAARTDQTGIVRGLAWTSVGGDTLEIEVNTMPGKGELKMTGNMGDVMKESAMIGLTYVRSIASDYNVPDDYFEKHDLHLHIPEGAVPKDGPSAGITMATAMLSAVADIKVLSSVAMTGEITLRGRVLPIGGLKEKLLAAKMAGISKVLVPEENRPDVAEMSDEITEGLKIVFVTCMDDVLKEALVR